MKDNRIVCSLTYVQCARFGYRNQYSDWRDKLPKQPTVRNTIINVNEIVFGTTQTTLQFAMAQDLLDKWFPVCRLKITANHFLTYTGPKAVSIFREWSRRQFQKGNRK